MTRLTIVFVVAVMGLGTGCATLFSGSTATIPVNSMPQGAQVIVDGAPMGVTPTMVTVNNHRDHVIAVQMNGASGGCQVIAAVSPGWVILDILAGLVPLIIDVATGDWKTVQTDQCNVMLQGGMPPPMPPGPAGQAPEQAPARPVATR